MNLYIQLKNNGPVGDKYLRLVTQSVVLFHSLSSKVYKCVLGAQYFYNLLKWCLFPVQLTVMRNIYFQKENHLILAV